jgi:beta-lactamase regulating signal transducer with metallopeptidase domain
MPIFLNWIWQGCLVTALVALAISGRRFNAATRERIWWVVLASIALMPVLPASGLFTTRSVEPLVVVDEPSFPWRPAVTLLWLAWVALSSWRLVAALCLLRRAKRSARPFPSDRLERLPGWSASRREGREARLAVSDDVTDAAVLGLRAPIVAVAPAALAALTDEELDRILVHELAHVRRYDDLAVLLQRIVGVLVGWHPAIWWLNRTLAFEREVACDDWVMHRTAAPRAYAMSLVKLVDRRCQRGRLSLAPSALLSRSALTRRVTQLLDTRRNRSVKRSHAVIGLAVPGIACAACAALTIELVAGSLPVLASEGFGGGILAPFGTPQPGRIGGPLPDAAARPNRALGQTAAPGTDGPVAVAAKEPEMPPDDALAGETLLPATSSSIGMMPRTSLPSRLPPVLAGLDSSSTPRAHAPPPGDDMPWDVAADAAVAVSRGSRAGAVKTAGFFSRFGKSIAGAF